MPLTSSAAPTSSSTAPPMYRRSPQQQREEQADAEQLECAVRRLDQHAPRRRAPPAHRPPRDRCGTSASNVEANSGMPGLTCAASQIASSARPRSPTLPGRNQRWRNRGQRAARALRAREDDAPSDAARPAAPAVFDDEIDDARVARRQIHLRGLQRERQGDAARRPRAAMRASGDCASRHQRDEDAERHVGDEVGDRRRSGSSAAATARTGRTASRAAARSTARTAAGSRRRSRARTAAQGNAAAASVRRHRGRPWRARL